MEKNISITNRLDFLSGGGEMGERIRNFDWTGTPLGNPETWEHGLKTCVRIVLTSAQPMLVWWGPSLINIYNDSYAEFMGKKHPAGLGAKAADVWKDAWDILLPRIERVQRNEGTCDEALLFILDRKGYHEEAYVSFCYSPVQGDDGTVNGLFCACSDNTERIVNERAVQTLHDLGAVVFDDKSLQVIYRNVADALGKNDRDFPFAIIYEIDNENKKAAAVASAGTNNKQYLLPATIDVLAPTTTTREFCQAYACNKLIVSEKSIINQDIPKGRWKAPANQFVYIPVSAVGSDHPYAIIFAALNPYRPFDNHFKQFCELIGERVALEINKMLALEEERKREEALIGIVEQKQYAKKLEEVNRELMKMNEELTSFAYVSSHDLQEPLRKIQMFSKRILEKEVNSLSEEGRNFFYRMDNAASRMQLLINDLLTYSRTNTSQKHFEKTDLNLLLAEVKLELYEKVTATGTIIESESLPALSIIPFQFKQLFTNLIANSIKFARPNVPPHITIKNELVNGSSIDKAMANGEKKYWHISLADNGTGFDQKFSEQIFGLFQRLHGRKDFEGTGIGLAIAKKVVENHSGFIMADGRENEGATIHLYLPA
jgi:signal transduction histidine kinase